MLKKVVIIGPESTGKSTLCEQLARHYNTRWCPEYAREYLLTHGMNYTYDDLLTIAKGQLAQEDHYVAELAQTKDANSQQPSLLFVDTDMYVMKVWCQFVFGKCHQWILDQLAVRKYDLYLLCNIDLPWVKDELREYPNIEQRQQLYTIYRELMVQQPLPWADISGTHEERWQKALAAVDALMP
ncbi:MAG TPA: AAA family ATPase [Chitinophagaceae bacterium]|nr:AAA family ATPase [Chitinophagaceae bacterium]